jgi:hypothetical protein
MPAPDIITHLVEQFEQNKSHYTSPAYNETELRVQFVDRFFQALGWDVNNAEQRFEVVEEDYVEVEEDGKRKPKRPDYGFRTGGQTRFFVEAKKPSVDLKGRLELQRQAREAVSESVAKTIQAVIEATDREIDALVYDMPSPPTKSAWSKAAKPQTESWATIMTKAKCALLGKTDCILLMGKLKQTGMIFEADGQKPVPTSRRFSFGHPSVLSAFHL